MTARRPFHPHGHPRASPDGRPRPNNYPSPSSRSYRPSPPADAARPQYPGRPPPPEDDDPRTGPAPRGNYDYPQRRDGRGPWQSEPRHFHGTGRGAPFHKTGQRHPGPHAHQGDRHSRGPPPPRPSPGSRPSPAALPNSQGSPAPLSRPHSYSNPNRHLKELDLHPMANSIPASNGPPHNAAGPPPSTPPPPPPPGYPPSPPNSQGKLPPAEPSSPPPTPGTITPQVIEQSEEVEDGLEEWDEDDEDLTKNETREQAIQENGIVGAILPHEKPNQSTTASGILACELPSLRPKELTAITSDRRQYQYMSTFRAWAWRAMDQKRPVVKGLPPPNWCLRFCSADGIPNLKALRPTPTDPRDIHRLTTAQTTYRGSKRLVTYASDGNDPRDDERLLLISNLSDNANESFLRESLQEFGTVVKVEPISYRGQYTGMTAVAFSSISEASYASQRLDGMRTMGRTLTAKVDPMHRLAKAALQRLIDRDIAEQKIKERRRLEEEEKRKKVEEEALRRRKEEEEAEKALREETKRRNAETERLEKLRIQRLKEMKNPVRTTPALRIAMLPASIGEVDLHTFFKRFQFRPSKIVAEGPFWLVFFRDKNMVPLAARRCMRESIMGYKFRIAQVDISEAQLKVLLDGSRAESDSRKEGKLVPRSKKELVEWATRALDRHYIEVIRNTLTEFELRPAARLLADQSFKSFNKTVITERRAAKGRGVNAAQPIQFDWFAKTGEQTKKAGSSEGEPHRNSTDSRRQRKRRLQKESDQEGDDDLDEILGGVVEVKTMPKKEDDFFVGFRERKARRTQKTQLVKDVDDSEPSDEDTDDETPLAPTESASAMDVDISEEPTAEAPSTCARLMDLVEIQRRQKTGWQPPEFLNLANSTTTPAADNARESRNESRKIRRGIEDLDLEKNDLISFNALIARKKAVRFGKSRIHGYGLYAMQHIEPGEFVIEYVGEVVRSAVADLREKTYERQGMGDSYLFRLDLVDVVDATRKGAVARFINHSCEPNLTAKIIQVENAPKIVFYTRQAIEVGGELTYDYKFNVESDEEKIPCLCGAQNCKGTLN